MSDNVIRFVPLEIEAVEAFIGGDIGTCSEHTACSVGATREGPLHLHIGDLIVRQYDGTFRVERWSL